MAWADLTVEQKDIVREYTRQFRANIGAMARLMSRFKALDDMYDAQVDDILPLIGPSLIVDESGLAGVSSLTVADVSGIAVYAIKPMLASYNGDGQRELYIRIAGMVNTIG
jgi:hypothetical protein